MGLFRWLSSVLRKKVRVFKENIPLPESGAPRVNVFQGNGCVATVFILIVISHVAFPWARRGFSSVLHTGTCVGIACSGRMGEGSTIQIGGVCNSNNIRGVRGNLGLGSARCP